VLLRTRLAGTLLSSHNAIKKPIKASSTFSSNNKKKKKIRRKRSKCGVRRMNQTLTLAQETLTIRQQHLWSGQPIHLHVVPPAPIYTINPRPKRPITPIPAIPTHLQDVPRRACARASPHPCILLARARVSARTNRRCASNRRAIAATHRNGVQMAHKEGC
jgi:hypothetical protein